MDKRLSGNQASQAAWNQRPVGSQRSRARPGELEYFTDLRAYRYGYETPFIPSFFDFPSLRDKTVLELGVGNGIDAVEMASFGAVYTGLDITERHLILTREYFRQRLGIEPRLWHGDLLERNIGERFDAIYSFGVLHHIEHERMYLKRARELLKSDGVLLIGVYSKFSFFNIYLLVSWIVFNRMCVPLDAWRSHVAELTDLHTPVPIRIRSRRVVEQLLHETGFRVIRYAKRGFVQGYLPLIGAFFRPDGAVLSALGALLGWYHLFVCRAAPDEESSVRKS